MKEIVKLVVSGPFACFTRPECKAEKMSYEVMTPSAARNILSSIYWKPEFDYKIKEIHALNPIKFISMTLNEVGKKGQINNTSDGRQQTRNLFLYDVCFGIVAEIILNKKDDTIKHLEIFKRRASKGQCFTNPYLGLKEHLAEWELVNKIPTTKIPRDFATKPLGIMLYDFKYIEDKKGKIIPKRTHLGLNTEKSKFRVEPLFFNATMVNGIVKVPETPLN